MTESAFLSPITRWMRRWKVDFNEKSSPAEFLRRAWGHVRGLPTKLGRFASVCFGEGVPPGDFSSMKIRDDDLFPLDLKEVATYLVEVDSNVADAVISMVNSLNFLACPST